MVITIGLAVALAIGLALSAWLYGPVWSQQREVAPPPRFRSVAAFAVLIALAMFWMYLTRTRWVAELGTDTAIRVFVGLILLLIMVLNALVPPQHDL